MTASSRPRLHRRARRRSGPASRERSRIRAWACVGVVPQGRVLDPGVQLVELSERGSQSKTPPEQFDALLDVGLGGLDIRSHRDHSEAKTGRGRGSGAPGERSSSRSVQPAQVLGGLRRRRRRRSAARRRCGAAAGPRPRGAGPRCRAAGPSGTSADRARGSTARGSVPGRKASLDAADRARTWRCAGALNGRAGPFLERLVHEVDEHRHGRGGAGLAVAQAAVVVEADEDPDHDVGREAHEPGRAVFVGGAGLAADRAAERRGAGRRCRAGPRPPAWR